jgi:hypothetical protein
MNSDRSSLTRSTEPPNDYVLASKLEHAENVDLLLDVMESHYFEDDLSSEPPRMDRFSRWP